MLDELAVRPDPVVYVYVGDDPASSEKLWQAQNDQSTSLFFIFLL
jgi:hypothetical protein